MLYVFLAIGLLCNTTAGFLMGGLLYGTSRGAEGGALLGFLITYAVYMMILMED